MPTVRHANQYNSTNFTTCCGVAINDNQQKCPRCKQDVFPFYDGMSDAERAEAAGGYMNNNTRMARWRVTKRSA